MGFSYRGVDAAREWLLFSCEILRGGRRSDSALRATIPGVQPLRTIRVTRYVTPLREGGSLPAIVEADDEGLYVLKFRGAGQGARALIAELVAGEIARAAGLPMPGACSTSMPP